MNSYIYILKHKTLDRHEHKTTKNQCSPDCNSSRGLNKWEGLENFWKILNWGGGHNKLGRVAKYDEKVQIYPKSA